MSPPKHLWSGDWEQESAAAAEERANREARAWPQPLQAPPEPEHPPRRPVAPSPPERPRTARTRRRIPRPRPRVALLSALALLLLAGAAYGLTSLHHNTTTASTGKAAWLGARLETWPAGGALVAHVDSGSPAASAGLKAGDIIIQVQGRPVTAPYNVTAAVAALSPGDRLQMQVVRGARTLPAIATLGARPHDAP